MYKITSFSTMCLSEKKHQTFTFSCFKAHIDLIFYADTAHPFSDKLSNLARALLDYKRCFPEGSCSAKKLAIYF